MLDTTLFDFDNFKQRISKLHRLPDPSEMSFTDVETLNDKSSLTEHQFITFHFYNFMADKKSHTEYPRSICELLCYFIARCKEFTFSLEPKPMCFNLIDIAERSKQGEVITDKDYSEAISTLLCELIQTNWGSLNELLDIFITAIEKDPWHKGAFTVWTRHDPEETETEKNDKKKLEDDYNKWKSKGKTKSYIDKYGNEHHYFDREQIEEQELRRLMMSNEFKNEQVRQRAIDNFKRKYTKSQYEDILFKVKCIDNPELCQNAEAR